MVVPDPASSGWQPVDPPTRPALLVNPRAGDGTSSRFALPERARELGIEVVLLAPDDSYVDRVQAVVDGGADALGMAGGDGSLAVVAAAAAAHDLPFICVPAGTRNHFALDLGVDRSNVLGALDAFGHAVERRIDMGVVNGHPYVNNVSLGIYGEAVHQSAYRNARCAPSRRTRRRCSHPMAGRRLCMSSTRTDATTSSPLSCWCRTTRTRWIAVPQARAPPWTAADWESSFSIVWITAPPAPLPPPS
jgi:hypothetical protein